MKFRSSHAFVLLALLCADFRGGTQAAEAGAHWSLKPLARVEVPAVKNAAWPQTPVDHFVLAALESRKMQPSVPAEKPALLRRAYLNLIGLPPTPEEQAAFAADHSPAAFAGVIDRLLARPEYGERWARHWLDTAHYAETHGHDQDRPRTNAWPYRDYVIGSLNGDKPYAQFVEEQIAGDALAPEDPRAIAAMGFLATGPWDESSLRDIRDDTIDRQIARYIDRDDMVATVMNTFVSTTVQCARCHDHKFDPVPQKEYYSLQAVFAATDKANRPYDPDPAIHRKRKELSAQRSELARAPVDAPDLCTAYAEWSAAASTLPAVQYVYAGASDYPPDGSFKPAGKPRPVHLLKRGDIHKPGELAAPGALGCVANLPGEFQLAPESAEAERRIALARWITDPKNALTWRSIVNRAWHYHFGRGLVATPNDFGRMGGTPSHPELLDWLANWFLENSGSLKKLHKLILMSAVYQQSAQDNPEYSVVDAENALLWRMNRSRLDAESVRDAILAVSGKLDPAMGGPSAQHFLLSPGIHVTPKVDYAGFDLDSRAACRRSVYRFIFRTLPDPFMDSLDCPDSSQLTPVRNTSVTVAQSLALLNDPFVLRYSEHFAARLEREFPGHMEEQLSRAIQQAFCRTARSGETAQYAAFVQEHGLAAFCRVIFNSNEFMFVN